MPGRGIFSIGDTEGSAATTTMPNFLCITALLRDLSQNGAISMKFPTDFLVVGQFEIQGG